MVVVEREVCRLGEGGDVVYIAQCDVHSKNSARSATPSSQQLSGVANILALSMVTIRPDLALSLVRDNRGGTLFA